MGRVCIGGGGRAERGGCKVYTKQYVKQSQENHESFFDTITYIHKHVSATQSPGKSYLPGIRRFMSTRSLLVLKQEIGQQAGLVKSTDQRDGAGLGSSRAAIGHSPSVS